MSTWKPIALVLLLVGGAGVLAGLVFAEPVFAEPEEEDISAKVQKQMEKIVELMRQNEQALLELSTGKRARPVGVDVVPPETPEQPGGSSSSKEGPRAGSEAAETMEELVRKQQKAGQQIPLELEELVRMVPL